MVLARDELSEYESSISIIEMSSIVKYESEEVGEEAEVGVGFFLGARFFALSRGAACLRLGVCGLASNSCRSRNSSSPVIARSVVSFVRFLASFAASTCAAWLLLPA